jgi:hypothetical protein
MALAKNITVTAFGKTLSFENAYHKVDGIIGSKDSINFKVNVFSSNGGDLINSKSFSFAPSLEGSNFIAQCYEQMKTLPEFAGAIDC